MWWGHSPALDIETELNKGNDTCQADESSEVLIVGASDARHVLKTIASSYKHPDHSPIAYHVVEPSLEQVARSILLLSTSLNHNLGLQEATRYYLEVLGNTLLRPATSRYLAKHSNQLVDVVTRTADCPWLSLDKFKHRDRDRLEAIFKFWERATCENVPIVEYWDRRVRRALETRYDYRDGVFDWDYHMVLKPRGASALTIQEYRFWRNNGIAFTWVEGEPIRSNPTLLSNVIKHGPGYLHYAYLGDIANGPFFVWDSKDSNASEKRRRTSDISEMEVMRAIHEIRTKEPLCEELIGAHRDPAILNGVIVTEMPENEMEKETWTTSRKKERLSWTDIKNHKVTFHPITTLDSMKSKAEYLQRFDAVWIAHNLTEQIPNVSPLLKKKAPLLVESRKYLVEFRKEDLENFADQVKRTAHDNGLREANVLNIDNPVFRFYKT